MGYTKKKCYEQHRASLPKEKHGIAKEKLRLQGYTTYLKKLAQDKRRTVRSLVAIHEQIVINKKMVAACNYKLKQ